MNLSRINGIKSGNLPVRTNLDNRTCQQPSFAALPTLNPAVKKDFAIWAERVVLKIEAYVTKKVGEKFYSEGHIEECICPALVYKGRKDRLLNWMSTPPPRKQELFFGFDEITNKLMRICSMGLLEDTDRITKRFEFDSKGKLVKVTKYGKDGVETAIDFTRKAVKAKGRN